VAGEGYQSRTSPHTKHELFVGLSLMLAQQVPYHNVHTAAFVTCRASVHSAYKTVVMVVAAGALLLLYSTAELGLDVCM